jgi:hypothetical protein
LSIFLRFTYFPADSPLWEFSEFISPNTWQACTTTAYARQWSLITGVRARDRHLLYVNGVLVDSTPNSYTSSTLSRDTSQDITIGRFMELITLPNNTNEYCFFMGAIDEVRIEHGARRCLGKIIYRISAVMIVWLFLMISVYVDFDKKLTR